MSGGEQAEPRIALFRTATRCEHDGANGETFIGARPVL
jgi:hypothetical protein